MFRSLILATTLILASSCSRNSQTWEDVKTTGRYMQKGVDSIMGKDYESRMLASGDQFFGPFDDDFIPLHDSDLKGMYIADSAMPQPKAIPGQFGLPNLDAFYSVQGPLQALFKSVHFNTDEHAIRDKEEVAMLLKLASHLKNNPNLYVVVEGHTDERASASYNLALGMRRANSVRSFLVKNGANLDRIFTISRGKEQPVAVGHTPDQWKLNRRSEFRVYEK